MMLCQSFVEPSSLEDRCPSVTNADEILHDFRPNLFSSSSLPSSASRPFPHLQQQLAHRSVGPTCAAHDNPHRFVIMKSTHSSSAPTGNGIHGEARQATDFNLEVLRQYFHLPLKEAARRLGSCEAVLKRVCRRKQIKRWPYRKVAAKLAKIHFLSKCLVHAEGHQIDRLQQRIQTYTQEYHDLMQGKGIVGTTDECCESSIMPSIECSCDDEINIKVEYQSQSPQQVQSPTSVASPHPKGNSLKMILDDCSVLGPQQQQVAIHI